jgi:hypothetical protein
MEITLYFHPLIQRVVGVVGVGVVPLMAHLEAVEEADQPSITIQD